MRHPIQGERLIDDPLLLVRDASIAGFELGPPRWLQCVAHGSARRPAKRMSVVREEGESCQAFWYRTRKAINERMFPLVVYHGMTITCMHTSPPDNPESADSWFNVKVGLMHTADHDPDLDARIAAVFRLADLFLLPAQQMWRQQAASLQRLH